MSIVWLDSFENQDSTRYTIASASYRSGGRGTGHVGCASYNSGGYFGVGVSAAATYGQAVAIRLNVLSATGVFQFREGSTDHVFIGFDASGHIEARRGDNSGTVLGTSASVVGVAGSYVHIEAKVTVNDSTGAVEVRANEIAVLTLSGIDTRNGGTVGTVDECRIGTATGNNDTFLDDWIVWNTSGSVNNDFIGDKRVGFSAPDGAGTYTAGTASSGTLLSCVDESVMNSDTDYITFDNTSLPKAATFTVENLPANAVSVLAVKPFAVARKDDAGTNTGRVLMISGATESDGGADSAPLSSYHDFSRIHETDPNTSAAWTLSAVNALEVGWRRTA